jgi:UDP-N-acetylmuramoylalanine--D-glutamate ligase
MFGHEGELAGTRAVVVGAGASGKAAALLLARLGAAVRLLDRKPDAVTGDDARALAGAGVVLDFGEHHAGQFAGAAMVVLSPGVMLPPLLPLLPAGDAAPEVISELELAGRYSVGRIVAVTGTNGKTTTSGLAAHVLQSVGLKVFLGGNIGTPLSQYVLDGQEADVLVLEVSSYQAQYCTSFRPDVAVLLNFSPNHLDHHADMAEYLDAKLNLFAHMRPEDLAVLPAAMRGELADRHFTRARIKWFESTDRFESDRLPGAHNQANMEAVFQATLRFRVDERCMRDALDTFEPYPHRLQRVGQVRGVTFVDDSKATTVDALRAALESFDGGVLLLAGGVYKGGDLASLAPLLRRKVRAVCLFGAGREVFEAAWAGHAPLAWEPTMDKAVARLMTWAEPGDTMLLSPATASFDLYANYKERGKHFQRVFEALR